MENDHCVCMGKNWISICLISLNLCDVWIDKNICLKRQMARNYCAHTSNVILCIVQSMARSNAIFANIHTIVQHQKRNFYNWRKRWKKKKKKKTDRQHLAESCSHAISLYAIFHLLLWHVCTYQSACIQWNQRQLRCKETRPKDWEQSKAQERKKERKLTQSYKHT